MSRRGRERRGRRVSPRRGGIARATSAGRAVNDSRCSHAGTTRRSDEGVRKRGREERRRGRGRVKQGTCWYRESQGGAARDRREPFCGQHSHRQTSTCHCSEQAVRCFDLPSSTARVSGGALRLPTRRSHQKFTDQQHRNRVAMQPVSCQTVALETCANFGRRMHGERTKEEIAGKPDCADRYCTVGGSRHVREYPRWEAQLRLRMDTIKGCISV